MITLGIDPGTARLGYGLIASEQDPSMVASGVIETPSSMTMPARLVILFDAVSELMARYQPTTVAVEQLFFARNVTTAIVVGQARGVVLLAAGRMGVPVAEYTPTEVKQAVTGYGNADKRQMQEMVRVVLGLADIPQPDDAADALAVALCHAQSSAFLTRARE